MSISVIEKTLSANDTGETGSHQSAIAIPKKKEFLDFFPMLNAKLKNPEKSFTCTDENNKKWEFRFIHYNNKFFGGTRNEYRLCLINKYVKNNRLKAGDIIRFEKDGLNYSINFRKAGNRSNVLHQKKNSKNDGQPQFVNGRLQLGKTWKIIER